MTDQEEKWHIFNSKCSQLKFLNNISFDDVAPLIIVKKMRGGENTYYSLTKDDKKALFVADENYFSPFLYDDICVSDHALIFTEGKKKWFQKATEVYFGCKKVLYDEIKIDQNGFVYGIDEDGIDIYEEYPFGYNFLFHTDYYD